MIPCPFCSAIFVNHDAYRIHLGFRVCKTIQEMIAKGMKQNKDGQWLITESFVVHRGYLKDKAS